MATTYEWNCKTVDVHPIEEEYTDVVYNVHWSLKGISDQLDPDGNPYQASSIGTQTVALDPESEFIPFDQLTNEIVVGWTKEAMGAEQVAELEQSLAAQIEEKINPTSITMTIGS